MICQRCLLRATTRSHTTPTARFRRPLSNALLPTPPISQRAAAATTITPTAPHRLASTSTSSSRNSPAATSASAAQPLSTPLTPPPTAAGVVEPGKQKPPPPTLVLSSVPAGTPLKGLNFEKGKSDPVALEDGEYPGWLWGVLDTGKRGKGAAEGEGEGEGDLFSKSKKQRRIAAKKLRKQALLHPESLVPKVPLYEQSVDLPAGNGTVEGALQAARAREELTRAMRKKRRSAIKEDNFLRAMG